jgi:predicted flap endonuclease-1-like 5' DNA nuclease
MKLVKVQGIGPVFAGKLEAAGVTSTDDLLLKGCTPHGRKEIATQSGISGDLILKWVNHVDLFRIQGVGPQYAELLEAAGVDTVVELGKRVPEHLLKKMAETNSEHRKVQQLPSLAQVTSWVEQAKQLPRAINY